MHTYIYIHVHVYTYKKIGRGLIHHAVLGHLLASAIIHDDETILPPITRRIAVLGA
jgi:hypothetical protein